MHFLKLFTLIVILTWSLLLNAEAYQDLKLVRQQVKDFLLSRPELKNQHDVQVKVHALDQRLKLARCPQIKMQLASGADLLGKTSIKVSCQAPRFWNFYVTAQVARFDDVYIANVSLSRGHIIRAGDVFKSRKNLASLPFGYITRPEDVIGKQLTRHIQSGRVLIPNALGNPLVIKRGEIVSLQRKASGFEISMKGIAMSNGAIGDSIRVKNASSKRVVEGRVTSAGRVQVGN